MDYGQTSSGQTTDLNSDFELDNFNLNTNEWGISTPEQSRRALGSSAINHTPNTAIEAATPTDTGDTPVSHSSSYAPVAHEALNRQTPYEQSPALGQITPNFPPGYQPPVEDLVPPQATQTAQATATSPYNLSSIAQKAQANQNLSSNDVKTIDSAVADLGRSGDIDTFYEQIRADDYASADAGTGAKGSKEGKQ